nr:hypothetical protein GTC16762_32300 [Pigmentibacter ruber]
MSILVNHFSCNQDKKLCQLIDERLLQLETDDFKNVIDYEILINNQKTIAANCSKIKLKIEEGYFPFPTNSVEFVNLILNINQEIFKNVKVKKLGRFRILNEDVKVDGDGIADKHAFLGVKSEEIAPNLKSVWDKLFANLDFNNKKHLEIVCSKFLVHFFAIHPFHDGNGRTARYFLDILFSNGKYQIEFPSTGKRRRQYIKGLRTAHRIRKEDNGKIDFDSCYILINLMAKIISIKKPSDELLTDEE